MTEPRHSSTDRTRRRRFSEIDYSFGERHQYRPQVLFKSFDECLQRSRRLFSSTVPAIGGPSRRHHNHKAAIGSDGLWKEEICSYQDADDMETRVFDNPLSCFGCGLGWLFFLLGFVFTPLWYYATFLYFGNYYHRDPRERAALLFPQSLSPGVCFSRILNTGDECKQCDGEPKRSKPSLKTITKFKAIGFAANRSSHVTTYDTLLKGPSIRKRLLRSHIDSYK
ncbi:unnamed protein product [Brassica oleracea]|uniref:(rape) hypothetical protein n=1 Tax=Brassica napus TaxID=3708 RepID=A0A816UJR9_BRANA|nr:unnamed protein product [Brassica napus]